MARRGTVWSGPRIRDAVAVLLVALFALLPFPDETYRARGALLIPALLPVVAVLIRRRVPLIAVGLAAACLSVLASVGILAPSALLALSICAFAVVDLHGRGVGLSTVIAACGIAFAANGVALDGAFFDTTALQFVLLVALGGALGDATRSRREFAAAMTERAEQAERTRDDEARRRVAEERVRIARDLHDVVAHQIAVISLNAGVASSALSERPERAREALTTVRQASRTVLTDIGGLLSMLRADDHDADDPLAPAGGLADLDALVARFRRAGLRLDVRMPDALPPLSPARDRVAHLVIQEALTNVHKHGTGRAATVAVRSAPDAVLIGVANPVVATISTEVRSGHGLRGLRERVAAVRGDLRMSTGGGVFSLEARLPVEPEHAA
ncbi:sensor histidine kinase [Microbacterium sp. NPDC089696]|uniref:sensor histidine kinase n=1 Tax=Microbacterium sp. NPDC089696 TaxID=3364199 RepID=UPI0037F3FCDD